MSLPTLSVEMDTGDYLSGFTLDSATLGVLDTSALPPTTPTYSQDITPYVRSVSINRGASSELDQIQAGSAKLVLDNRDGRFTPYNASSPYYPNILPMRRIRIRATHSAVTYPVFQGFVESWPMTFPGDVDTIISVDLVDGFKVLSLSVVSGTFAEESSGTRISNVLTEAQFGGTSLDTGLATVPAITLDNVAPLQHIQDIEFAEGGRFFIDRAGVATFKDRSADVPPDPSTRTWADDGTGMSYRDIRLTFADTLITNDVHLTRTGGVEQTASDTTSQSRYGLRSTAITDIQLSTDIQVSDRAAALIERYAEPRLRIEGLVDNAMRHGYWDRVLAREISDVVYVTESRSGTAQASVIEGIHHEIGQDAWTVSFDVSPTVIEAAGILDDTTYGVLDSTLILAR